MTSLSKEFAESKGIELLDFDTLLKESDFISVHVPLVKETRNLINKDTIAKMKKEHNNHECGTALSTKRISLMLSRQAV